MDSPVPQWKNPQNRPMRRSNGRQMRYRPQRQPGKGAGTLCQSRYHPPARYPFWGEPSDWLPSRQSWDDPEKRKKQVRLFIIPNGRALRNPDRKFFLAFSLQVCYSVPVSICRCDGMVDVVDSKSTASDGVPVRVRSPAPRRSKLYIACSDLFYKSERAHAAAPPHQIEPAALGFDLVLSADLTPAASVLLRQETSNGSQALDIAGFAGFSLCSAFLCSVPHTSANLPFLG